MDTKKILLQQTKYRLEQVLTRINTTLDVNDLAEKYVQEVYIIEPTAQNLLIVEVKDEDVSQVIKFDLLAAAGFVASLIGGVGGADNPLLLGAFIISSVSSFLGLFNQASSAEALLFWVLYNMVGHKGDRKMVQKNFESLCKESEEVEVADFFAALQRLMEMGVIKQRDNLLEIADKLVHIWYRE